MLAFFLDDLIETDVTLDEVLAEYAGLTEGETGELRKQLKGTRLLLGGDESLRLRKFTFPTSDTLDRPVPGVSDHPDTAKLKARALLGTGEGQRLFDALVQEGIEKAAPRVAMRRAVILMALLCANFREHVRAQQEAGWPY